MNPQEVFLLESTGRVFGLDQQTLIQIAIQLFNAGFLAVVLAFLLYKPVRTFLQKRAERIQAQFDGVEKDMAKARELKELYEEKLRMIDRERNEILDSAYKLAIEKSEQLLDEAKQDAETIRARARTDIQMEQERVKDELKHSVIDISSVMATKFVTYSMDKDMQDKLFAETMAELEELTWQS